MVYFQLSFAWKSLCTNRIGRFHAGSSPRVWEHDRDSLLGLIFGLVIIWLCYCCWRCVMHFKGLPGWMGYFGHVGAWQGLVGVFVYGSRQRRQEREAKIGLPQKS